MPMLLFLTMHSQNMVSRSCSSVIRSMACKVCGMVRVSTVLSPISALYFHELTTQIPHFVYFALPAMSKRRRGRQLEHRVLTTFSCTLAIRPSQRTNSTGSQCGGSRLPDHHQCEIYFAIFAIVTPAPPSPSFGSSNDATYEFSFNALRTASRILPVPLPCTIRTNNNPAE